MEIGKVPESVLKRSIFKQIHTKRPEVLVGAGVGEDCAAMELARRKCSYFPQTRSPVQRKIWGHLQSRSRQMTWQVPVQSRWQAADCVAAAKRGRTA